MSMILSAQRLTMSYADHRGQKTEILHGIDLAINEGEMVAIVGPSGSGKSTLLHCLAGLERATSGTVNLVGIDLGQARAKDLAIIRRATIGFVFQQYNLLDSLTAFGNVALQTRLAGLPVEAAKDALAEVGLADKLDQKPVLLSGGEQQRVAIARALAVGPRVLFTDEPTGALDSASGIRVLELLRAHVKQRGSTVIMVTHDLEAASLADRILILKDGVIHADVTDATPASLLAEFEAIEASAPVVQSLP